MTQTPRDDLPHKGQTVVGSTTEQEPPAAPPPKLDTGLACLGLMARLHGVAADADQLAHEAAMAGRPLGTTDLLLAAKRLELQAKAVQVDVARLAKTPLPAVAVGHAEDGSVEFFIVARVDGDQVLIQSPAIGRPETLRLTELQARWKR